MKVLRLISNLDPTHGGPPVSAVNSAIAVARRGIRTHVAFTVARPQERVQSEGARRLIAEGIGVTGLPQPRLFADRARAVGYSPKFHRYIAENAGCFDLVHVHGPWTYPAFIAVRRARRLRQPVVMTPHEALTSYDLGHARIVGFRTIKAFLKTYYRKHVDAIVFSSPLELADSVSGPPPPNWQVIWHPVFDERNEDAAMLLNPDGEKAEFRIGMLGRFHNKKNIDKTIRALAGLPHHAVLHLAGTGDSETTAWLHHCAAAAGVEGRIRWVGFVSGTDKRAFLQSIDLLAMPSEYECFGMAAAEAMLAGRPVLVTPRVGVAEIVRRYDAGYVTSADVASLSAVFHRAMANRPHLGELGRRAARAAHSCFSFDSHGKALEALYFRLMREESCARGARLAE